MTLCDSHKITKSVTKFEFAQKGRIDPIGDLQIPTTGDDHFVHCQALLTSES